MKVKVKKTHPDAIVPQYATEGAACFDLHALEGGEVGACSAGVPIRTGLSFEIPPGHVMRVYSRSGHGFKQGIRLANSVGLIDSDYRGEVMVKLRNDSVLRFDYQPGDRIAQALIEPIDRAEFEVVDELSETERGTGGFGSTGQAAAF